MAPRKSRKRRAGRRVSTPSVRRTATGYVGSVGIPLPDYRPVTVTTTHIKHQTLPKVNMMSPILTRRLRDGKKLSGFTSAANVHTVGGAEVSIKGLRMKLYSKGKRLKLP